MRPVRTYDVIMCATPSSESAARAKVRNHQCPASSDGVICELAGHDESLKMSTSYFEGGRLDTLV